ncbi:uncharacterized protein LOC132726831 [Ruditapes philippinarum]|uniref:uncharacterized protein LOC132726831 n=1 Tax=Ruditapes philippinarum TaxID=129788 RepID=UPI00295A7E9D|nr:uncharacterized protein LOC132726831 [Ruditapes philippinarum]
MRQTTELQMPAESAFPLADTDRCPTSSTRKADIPAWLRQHNITFSEDLLKVELLAFCKQQQMKLTYVVDKMSRARGHSSIRLPPYHAELNPIELIWSQLKGYVGQKNLNFRLSDVQHLVNEAEASITSGLWAECCSHVEKIEAEYWRSENIQDELDDSSSSDNSDDETDTASKAGETTETTDMVDEL